jgi:hypothetical protein
MAVIGYRVEQRLAFGGREPRLTTSRQPLGGDLERCTARVLVGKD